MERSDGAQAFSRSVYKYVNTLLNAYPNVKIYMLMCVRKGFP